MSNYSFGESRQADERVDERVSETTRLAQEAYAE